MTASRPRLAVLVNSSERSDPWLRWCVMRLTATDIVDIEVQIAPNDRVDSVERLSWRGLSWLEQRLLGDAPWPIVDKTPERPSSLEPVDIVLDLTGRNTSMREAGIEAPEDGVNRWTLQADGLPLSPTSRRLGYGAVEQGRPTTHLQLFARCGGDEHTSLLAKGEYSTRGSGALNRRLLLGKVPSVVAMALARHVRRARPERPDDGALLEPGWNGEFEPPTGSACSDDPRRSAIPEASSSVLPHLSSLLDHERRFRVNNLRRRLRLRPEMWSLYVGEGNVLHTGLTELQELRPPGNEYWADPFFWQRDGRTFIYYEAYDYVTLHGRIAVGELSDSGFHVVGDVLKLPVHLSYPHLIEHDGELLLIPESSRVERVDIWRCRDFPCRFDQIGSRFEGHRVVDLTLFCREEQWWAFCTFGDPVVRDANSELHLFAIDGPLMQAIEPHPMNPVVTDSRVARPAGRVFEQDGRWYRPSQNNSHGIYGHGLNLMEITRLDRLGYEERPVRQFAADFDTGLIGTHHLDRLGRRFVVDGCHAVGGRATRD